MSGSAVAGRTSSGTAETQPRTRRTSPFADAAALTMHVPSLPTVTEEKPSLRPGGIVAVLEVLRPESPNSAGQTGALLDLFFALTSLSGCWSSEDILSWQRQAKLIPQKRVRLLSIPGAAIQVGMKAK